MSTGRHSSPRLGDSIASLVAIAIGLGVMSVAVGTLRFEALADGVRKAIGIGQGQLSDQIRSVAMGQAGSWTGFGPVAARARSLQIDIVLARADPDTHDVEAAVSKLVELKPTHGLSWQSTVQLRVLNGASASDVKPLVRMARIMAPHDGHVMIPRALFGIRNWTALDDSDKARTVSDIRGLMRAQSHGFQWPILAEAVGEQSEKTRLSLRSAIASGQPSDDRILKALGL